jgi:putative peptidoglycan lipid II flippase
MAGSLNTTIRVILSLSIPAGTLLIVGIKPLANILGFDPLVTEQIIWITRAYALGLVSYAIIEVTARAFYAQQNARTPLYTITLTTAVFLALGIPLANWLGGPGIALANSTAFSIQLIIMLWLLNRKFPGFADSRSTLRRVLPGSLVSGLLVVLLYTLIPFESLSTLMGASIAMGVILISGAVVLPFIWPEIKAMTSL